MTTIKLDRRALAYIIESDPEFHLELQRSILAEAIRKMVPKDVKQLAEILTPEVFSEMLVASKMSEEFKTALEKALHGKIVYEGVWRDRVKLSEKQREHIQKAVDQITSAALQTATDQRGAAISEAILRAETRLQETIDQRLEKAIGVAFEQRVNAEVMRRLSAVAEGVRANTESAEQKGTSA